MRVEIECDFNLLEKLAEEHGCVLVKKEDWDKLSGADTPSVPAMYLGDWYDATWLDVGSSVTITRPAIDSASDILFESWNDVIDEHKAKKSSAFDAIKDVCGG